MSSIASSLQSKSRSPIPPWLADRWGMVGIVLTLYILIFLTWTHFHWGGPELVTLLGDLAVLPPMMLATFMAWRVAKQSTLMGRLRQVWFILGLSFFTNFIGNVIWTYLENVPRVEPFPSIADIFYLASYPLMLWGLLTWPGMPHNRRERIVVWLDLTIVLIGASMFVGYFLIVPTAAVNDSSFLTQFLATAYPISSLVLLGGMLSILYRRPSSDTQAVFLLLFIGTIAFLASDFAFGYSSLAGTYAVGGWVDTGWNIAQLFFVLAALRQMHHRSAPVTKWDGISFLDRLAYLLPFAGTIFSYGLVLYITLTNFSQAAEWLFVAAVLLTVLIIIRQLVGPRFSVASLRTKLILTFVLVCVLSIGLVTLFTYLTLRSNAESAWQTLLITTLIVLLLTTGAAVLLAQIFVAPVARLTHVAARIATGDLRTKAQVESRDEIGTLAITFNTMLDALLRALGEQEALAKSNAQLVAEVERQKGDLEVRVAQRTAELNTLNRRLQEELSERQKLVQSLRESEERFRLLFAASPDAILLIDPHDPTTVWPIVDCNELACQMNGYTREELIGQSIDILNLKRGEREDFDVVLENLRHEGVVRGLETNHRRKDGHIFPVEYSTSLIRVGNRELILGIDRDITERQQLVQSLREREQQFRLLFDASPDAILLIDPSDPNNSWPILDCNEVACTMNGYTREELIGQSIDILNASPADPAERESYLERIHKQGILHHESLHRHKDGHLFPIEISTSLLTFEGREMILGIDREITERKQTEVALQQAKEMAESASRAKSEFLSRMSHELRTPMNAILGFAQLLSMSHKEPLTATQKERVRQITKGGQHLLDLINEILDISRIEAGRLQISPEPVPVRESIQEVLDLTAPLAADRHIQIQTSLEKGSNPYVLADRQRLKQVLLNLLSNAVKYNYDGGFVMVACEQSAAGSWRISVTDTGAGVPAEDIGRLFLPFERLVGEQSNVEGTGLGLALAKRLVEMMEGRIGVESVVGQGSTFWIELPRAESQLERLQRTGGTGQLPVMSPTSRRILYVEDNIANFELIQQVLADYDQIDLLWAADFQTGLESARLHHPNLILLDLHLGGRDGAHVLKQLKEDAETVNIPVIIVSADATPGQIERLISLGAHSYLTKPLDIKRFIQMIEELLTEKEH